MPSKNQSGRQSAIDPDEAGLSDEQAQSEQLMADQVQKDQTAKIGSEHERTIQAALDEQEAANQKAEEAVAEAAVAKQKLDAAQAKLADAQYQQAMKDTYTVFAKENHRLVLRTDDKKRIPLSFNQHTLIINPPLMDMFRKQFDVNMTSHQLAELLRQQSNYGVDFLIVAGPNVKLTPGRESFRQSIVKAIVHEQQVLITGARATKDAE